MDMKDILAKLGEIDSPQAVETTEEVNEGIVVQADGDEAVALLGLLKNAGVPAPEAPVQEPEMVVDVEEEEEEEPEYSNSPDEVVHDVDAAIPSGNDLNRSKTMTKHGYQQGDNPMAMEEVAKLEGKLKKMFESMSDEGK